jgi:dienelactone hydrolase
MDNSFKNALICLILLICIILPNKLCAQKEFSINISGTEIEIKIPEDTIKGCILVLPGWNFKQDDICQKSEFCNMFVKQGYALVLPNMLKSIYALQIYKETRPDWQKYPSLNWVTDSLIPIVQKQYNLLLIGQNNFVFGISTGGRGVAMILEQTDNIFNAGAALSGDFNPLLDINDNLMIGYFGSYNLYPNRWTDGNNPFNNASKIKVPMLLSHGKADKIVPFKQSEEFYFELIKTNPKIKHQLILVENAGHSYEFWSKEYKNVLAFFKINSRK